MSESQWNFLGLSHNPFSDPQKEFFPGADRELLLGKVRTLNEWSRPIVAVTGPHGVGKTCLFRALSSSLEAGVVAARVNGSLVSRAGDVLSALVQGYGVAAPSGADSALLIELIIAHLKDQTENDRTSLVLVDDAHLLEQRAVDDLVNLAAAGARLAFFSEPQFVESLQRAVERNAETTAATEAEPLLWHEMLLSPFNIEQTAEYLEWRFDEAGYNGRMPFSEYQVNGIQQAAEGYPGRLDFAANEQLMLMTVGGRHTGGIPTKHLVLAGSLAGVLALVLWFWNPDEDGASGEANVVALEMPKDNATESAVEVDRPTDALDSTTPDTRLNRTEAALVQTQQNSRPTGATIEEPVTPDVAERTVDLVEEPVTLSRTIQPVEPEPEVPVPAISRTVQVDPLPEPAPKPQPKPQTKPQTKPKPVVESVASVTSGRTTEISSSASGVRNASWLLLQNDASYTIQLIGFGELARAKSYLSEQARPADYALFRTRSGANVVHVVTYGIYDTQLAAEAEVSRLPATIGKVSPWVRPIRSVKAAIKTALQSDE